MSVDVNKLRALLAAATPGPWECVLSGPVPRIEAVDKRRGMRAAGDPHPVIARMPKDYAPDAENAELITAAVNALPELLAEVERLRAVEAQAVAMRRVLEHHAQVRRQEQHGQLHSEHQMSAGCLCRWCETGRALASDAGRAVLAEVERLRAENARLIRIANRTEAVRAAVGEVLAANGCECECGCYVDEHDDDDCERCLGCRVEMAMSAAFAGVVMVNAQ